MKYLMYLQLFAHAHQERWSSLVDKKLRQTLVTRDNYIFNTNYEGNPKAGKVKIPVRDTEVTVKAYNKATGVDLETGSTTYMDLDIDQDMAVNELIDGYDAVSVPDNLVADRLDSAGYSLALDMDKKSINLLETTASGFKMIIYGPCINPLIRIAGHVYELRTTLYDGEYAVIDSSTRYAKDRKIIKVKADGTEENLFNSKNNESSIWEKIPAGLSIVSWNGAFGFDIILFNERGTPRWTLHSQT